MDSFNKLGQGGCGVLPTAQLMTSTVCSGHAPRFCVLLFPPLVLIFVPNSCPSLHSNFTFILHNCSPPCLFPTSPVVLLSSRLILLSLPCFSAPFLFPFSCLPLQLEPALCSVWCSNEILIIRPSCNFHKTMWDHTAAGEPPPPEPRTHFLCRLKD